MSNTSERRREIRLDLACLSQVFRTCDLDVAEDGETLDAVIENISPGGVCLRFEDKEQAETMLPGKRVFFHGCIFNDHIGFLSSYTGVVCWKGGMCCGVKLTKPLDVDSGELADMIGAKCEIIRDYTGTAPGNGPK